MLLEYMGVSVFYCLLWDMLQLEGNKVLTLLLCAVCGLQCLQEIIISQSYSCFCGHKQHLSTSDSIVSSQAPCRRNSITFCHSSREPSKDQGFYEAEKRADPPCSIFINISKAVRKPGENSVSQELTVEDRLLLMPRGYKPCFGLGSASLSLLGLVLAGTELICFIVA